jgi:hypothetical protein
MSGAWLAHPSIGIRLISASVPTHRPTDPSMTVTISRTEVRPDMFVVYWSEPSIGTTVVHVQDFENGKVWTKITMPVGTLLNRSGTLAPVPRT